MLRNCVTGSPFAIIGPTSLLVYLSQYFGDALSTPNVSNIEPIGAALNALFRKFISESFEEGCILCGGRDSFYPE